MIDLLRKRRSIRRYRPTLVPADMVERLKESLLRAPSSRGLGSRRFVFVTDAALLAALAQAKSSGAAFLSGAPLGIVVCGDPEISDVWVEDCAIAAIIAQLTATDMGLGSCWVQMRNRTNSAGRPADDTIQELLSLPPGMHVDCVIAVGFPAEEKPPIAPERLQRDSITEL